jgi:hypothetical protein
MELNTRRPGLVRDALEHHAFHVARQAVREWTDVFVQLSGGLEHWVIAFHLRHAHAESLADDALELRRLLDESGR